jgi:hypothetical protein
VDRTNLSETAIGDPGTLDQRTGHSLVGPVSERSRFPSWITAFLVVALIIAARNPVALTRAEFWAEDSSEFFVGAFTMGARSLWVPVWGYYFLVSRAIAWVATWFAVLWAPYTYAISSLLLDSLAISYFVRDGFAWLLPGRGQRFLVCLILSVGPGTSEIFLNLSNLPAALTFLCLLLLLEEPLQLAGWRLLLLLVLVPSAGQSVLLAPVILGLWHITRQRRYLVFLAYVLLVAAANAAGSQKAAMEAGILGYEHFGDVPRIFVTNALVRFFVGPFFGPLTTGFFLKFPAPLFWLPLLVATTAFLLAVKVARPERRKLLLLALAYLSSVGVFAIVAVARNYAFLQIERESGWALWNLRYSFLPGSVAVLIWSCVCFAFWKRSPWRMAAFAGVTLLAFHNLSQWNVVYERRDLHWPEKAAKIQRLLDLKSRGELDRPRVRRVPAHPLGWYRELMPVTISP